MSIQRKLDKAPPYKLLACDGGGIRGTISIEILAKIEDELRASSGKPSLVLADYFDYVAGTSTGAIIATLVALGYDVATIRDFYLKSGAEMFEPAALWERLHTKFDSDNLSRMLKEIIGEHETLGSDKFKTLLMVVLRNATTDSPWPISNNPKAKYNDRETRRDDSNLNLPLWQLVRASTAAPTFFPPETIQVGTQRFVFVDGGVTMYNDPAFQLFLMATTEPYKLCWETGREKMLLVSVGTGASADANSKLTPREMSLLYNASHIPSALMAAALHEQDFLCRTFGDCLAGGPLDREIGDMIGRGIPGLEKLFTYVRYNADLSRGGLDALGLQGINPEHVQQMDSVDHIGEMQQVGRAAAERYVHTKLHFAAFPA
ncbi:MAG TPA: patatin-like phospholipase family protein [Terrimicrobiaceae bacterium]